MLDDNTIIEVLIDELKETPDGTETTTADLVRRCGFDDIADDKERIMTIHKSLLKAARKAHISLDSSKYKYEIVGMPYNIPYVVSNEQARTKCPRCGSLNTATILYGMPAMDETLLNKINAGKGRLGGCFVTGLDASHYCNDCDEEFGEKGIITREGQIELFSDAVTEIRFVRRYVMSPLLGCELEIVKNEKGAHVNVNDESPFEYEEYDITKRKWSDFVESLYYKLYLHDWKKRSLEDPRYVVMDGEEWELTVKTRNGKEQTYRGTNAYPPYWKEFEKLIKSFKNKKN